MPLEASIKIDPGAEITEGTSAKSVLSSFLTVTTSVPLVQEWFRATRTPPLAIPLRQLNLVASNGRSVGGMVAHPLQYLFASFEQEIADVAVGQLNRLEFDRLHGHKVIAKRHWLVGLRYRYRRLVRESQWWCCAYIFPATRVSKVLLMKQDGLCTIERQRQGNDSIVRRFHQRSLRQQLAL